MATVFTHAFVASLLAPAGASPVSRRRLVLTLMALAVLPDLDVVGFAFGIPYGDVLGHRGITHSFAFAAVVACVVAFLFFRGGPWVQMRLRIVVYLFLATASHGVLDAMTSKLRSLAATRS